jgi:hypothetical protein
MIFLASPEALQPGSYTLTELGHAKRSWRSGRGRVLPVLLGDAPMERLDPYLRVLNVLRPVGNARAEVLTEARRLWPMPATPAPSATPGRRLGRAPRTRLLLSAALLSVLCLAGFLGYRQFDVVPDAKDATVLSGPDDNAPLISGPEDGTALISGPEGGTPLISGPEGGTPLISGRRDQTADPATGSGTATATTTATTGEAGTTPRPGDGAQTPELTRALALRERAQPLLKLVRDAVSGDEYDAPDPDALRPSLSASTIADIVAWQRATRTGPENEQTVGAYQFVSADLKRLAANLALAPEKVAFTPEIQDAMALVLLEQSGLGDFLSGRMSEADFANEIAKLWAAFPVVSDVAGPDGERVERGSSYYRSYGKRPGVEPDRVLAALRDVQTRAG